MTNMQAMTARDLKQILNYFPDDWIVIIDGRPATKFEVLIDKAHSLTMLSIRGNAFSEAGVIDIGFQPSE